MGMTTKYSRSIYEFAESVDNVEHGCSCNECHACGLGDWLFNKALEVDNLESLYDALLKENKQLKEATNAN